MSASVASSSSSFTPTLSTHHHHRYLPSSASHISTPQFLNKPKRLTLNSKPTSKLTPFAALSDPFVLQIAETLEDSISPSSSSTNPPIPLQKLRDHSSESLLSLSWPTRKDEPFRFTDTSFIKSSEIRPITDPPKDPNFRDNLTHTHLSNALIIDGFLVDLVSGPPEGVYVGSLAKLDNEGILKRVSEFVGDFDGDVFWSLNGVGAQDVVVVYVPEGCRVEEPLHFRYEYVERSELGSNMLPVSNPRVLVVVEKGGEVGIIEEYGSVACKDECYWNNSVIEIVIGEGATVSHSYLQAQSSGAAHIKSTLVKQESASTYKLVEVSAGGKLSRHNLNVQQLGPDTVTELSTLHLSVRDQTQDLHSKLVLDHPRGRSSQLHKCIVAHPRGQAVFDGNVKVNRYAQQTDAGQLTRSLLLVPQATVNVKPNLQIIADDVKCSHGAAISDLENDQLFYFQARGIDLETARKALILSFALEVIERIPFASAQKKAKNCIVDSLKSYIS